MAQRKTDTDFLAIVLAESEEKKPPRFPSPQRPPTPVSTIPLQPPVSLQITNAMMNPGISSIPSIPRRTTNRSRPACTHINMERLYGPFSCDFCHLPSPLGWLYRCSQDTLTEDLLSPCDYPMDDYDPDQDAPPTMEQELRAFGFSKSIISQILAGAFTPAQISKLKAQKRRLRDVIAAEPSVIEANKTCYPRLFTPFWNDKCVPPTNDWTSHTPPGPPIPINQKQRPCRFKCCHHCRPYMADRCFTSLDAVFANEVRPLSVMEANFLPMKSAQIASNIGQTAVAFDFTPESPINLAPAISRNFFDSGPNTSEDTTPTTTSSDSFPYTDSTSSSDGGSQEAQRSHDDGLGTTLEPVTKSATDPTDSRSGRTTVTTPDHYTHRTIRHVGNSLERDSPARSISSASRTGSSVSLPTPSTSRTSPVKHDLEHGKDGKDLSSVLRFLDRPGLGIDFMQVETSLSGLVTPPTMSRSSSTQSMCYYDDSGDEMEVDGGIALTEEAVRTHTPDLITRDLEEELNNIMAQV